MRFKKKMPRHGDVVNVKDLLPGIIDQLDAKKEFTFERLASKWTDLVGDIMSTHTVPDRIFGRTLFVIADHPVFANELAMNQSLILKKIESDLNIVVIKKIKVDIKKISWKR